MSVDHRLETIQQENTRHTTDHRQVSFGLRQPSFLPVPSGLLQRKCACGGTPGVDGECAECRAKRLGSQRQVNDQAMPPIVHEVLRSPGQPLDASTRAFMEPRFGHDFSQVRVHTGAPQGLRASLAVNQPGDEYEQEADQVAEQVMRMPEPHASIVEQANGAQPIVQRSPLTPSPSPTEGERSGVPPIVREALGSPGQPLDAARTFVEPRFGHDFRRVRVRTGAPIPARSAGGEMPEEGTMTTAKASHNSIDLAFDPTTTSPKPRCDRILFVQMIQHTADGAAMLPGAYWRAYVCRDATALPSGHYIDHADCAWTTPYAADYGIGKASTADKVIPDAATHDTLNTSGGDRKFRSAANPNGWQTVVFHFESYAFCAAGRKCGTWYDGVAWDYTKTAADEAAFHTGVVTVTGALAPPAPGANVIQAFNSYNQARGFVPCLP
jgi:hypothetical protein